MNGNSRQAIRRLVRTPTSGIAGVVGTARVNGGSPQPSTGLRASIHSHPTDSDRFVGQLGSSPSGGISPVCFPLALGWSLLARLSILIRPTPMALPSGYERLPRKYLCGVVPSIFRNISMKALTLS
jgi:hypothetical protein